MRGRVVSGRRFYPSSTPYMPRPRTTKFAFAVAAVALGTLTVAFALPHAQTPASESSLVASDLMLPLVEPLSIRHGPLTYDIAVENQDTLTRVLQRAGNIEPELPLHFQRDPAASRAARQLRPGQALRIQADDNGALHSITIPLAGEKRLSIARRDGLLVSQEGSAETEAVIAYASGSIDVSLFAATDKAGLPESVAMQLAEIFSGDIDFHRDLRQGDRFAVVFERRLIDGRPSGAGQVLAASFTNGGRQLTAVRYAGAEGRSGYYSPDGQSMKKAFLRSPLEFSRITSRFSGARRHPVLQLWRAHTGIDYGAPIGTPVRSTADGVVSFAGQRGGYGNLIVIRHRGDRSTAYGHLNGFAKGIRAGQSVQQGETIGYVGKTGLASGPHLHYEFRVAGRAVNPLTATVPQAPALDRAEKSLFLPHVALAREQLLIAESIAGDRSRL